MVCVCLCIPWMCTMVVYHGWNRLCSFRMGILSLYRKFIMSCKRKQKNGLSVYDTQNHYRAQRKLVSHNVEHQPPATLPTLPHSIPINNQYAQHEYLFEYIDGWSVFCIYMYITKYTRLGIDDESGRLIGWRWLPMPGIFDWQISDLGPKPKLILTTVATCFSCATIINTMAIAVYTLYNRFINL